LDLNRERVTGSDALAANRRAEFRAGAATASHSGGSRSYRRPVKSKTTTTMTMTPMTPILAGHAGESRASVQKPQAQNLRNDQKGGHDVIQKTLDDRNEDAGDERGNGLQVSDAEVISRCRSHLMSSPGRVRRAPIAERFAANTIPTTRNKRTTAVLTVSRRVSAALLGAVPDGPPEPAVSGRGRWPTGDGRSRMTKAKPFEHGWILGAG
jgi:hypothetical protein